MFGYGAFYDAKSGFFFHFLQKLLYSDTHGGIESLFMFLIDILGTCLQFRACVALDPSVLLP